MAKASSPHIDADQVGQAAKLLKESDFQLFARAYKAWFGREATEAELEPVFCRYLLEGAVPFWVRRYVRPVLCDQALRRNASRARRKAAWGRYLPLVFEYALIMYFLLRQA